MQRIAKSGTPFLLSQKPCHFLQQLMCDVVCTKMKNNMDINIELRSEILEIALNLENTVNELLLALLLIETPNRKAISNKSGNLSFKNKIDLLFDLDVLKNDEHKTLLLLMEFRNQFLHNINCCSFKNALEQLGIDKEKKLLKFDDAENIHDKEFRYKNAFRSLNIKCLNIISKKIEDRKNQIEDRRKAIVKPVEAHIFFINKYFDLLEKIAGICEQNISETPELTNLINQIFMALNDDMESLRMSNEYSEIENELEELRRPEKIKSLFKI